jgi:hypothetical protein
MQLTTDQLTNFKQLFKSHFDIDLKDSEALELWTILVNHVKIVFSNPKKIWKQ